ncbi:hypothetical protein GCM10022419_109330 [Nonomuraea rosea]|uniref:HTH tetR-type domain-containing protein n=1 Tax=Nonomuraea rosea TaxID=638574 RepID=A0ABP6ZFV3_9ACTN
MRLALDEGLEAATVEAISAAADISPRTFFNYFATKEEALVLGPIWQPEELVDLLASRPADEPVFLSMQQVMRELAERMRPVFADMQPFMELRARHPELAARARAADESKIMETIIGAVGSRPGVVSGMHARMLVIASFGAAMSAIHESLEGGGSVQDLLDEAFTLLENGL